MRKINIYTLSGKTTRKTRLPRVFQMSFRPDVIRRVVVALQSHRIQPQGRNVMAGKRTTAESFGVGLGISRIPRVKGSRHRKAGQGAFAPGTVGGRQAHPPKVEKKIYKRINKKEGRLAIRSAIAATADKSLVASRGHVVEKVPSLPIVVSDRIQSVREASRVKKVFEALGVWSDVERVKSSRKIRAGKGKMRGRRTKMGVGPLIVVSEDRGIGKAASNHLGVDVVKVEDLNAELLAPGTHAGRLTIWTESAIKKLNNLFA
ncbi:MAG: 50S ribosomal protein L4 [Candidatus Bathyarchaeota archaeon]|nr:50S ribosomal protein L4 [Candidatus Bathyarchaeota archaeon]